MEYLIGIVVGIIIFYLVIGIIISTWFYFSDYRNKKSRWYENIVSFVIGLLFWFPILISIIRRRDL